MQTWGSIASSNTQNQLKSGDFGEVTYKFHQTKKKGGHKMMSSNVKNK